MYEITPKNLKTVFKEIFVDNYPGRLTIMMGYLPTISDTLFSEIDKTFNGDSNPGVAEYYWVRQAHCFLSRYQESLYSSKVEVNKRRKNIIQELLSSMIDGYERKILEFKSRLTEYCKKGQELWEILAMEGFEEGNLEKFVLCSKNGELYQEEKKEIENDELNHPYLFFEVDEESQGVDETLIQFVNVWKRYYHPVNDDYLPLHKRLLPEKC